MLVFHASADRRISPRDGHLDHSPMNERGESTLRPVARRWLSALSLGIVAVYALFYAIFLSQSGPKDGDQFLVFHSLQYWNASMFGMAKQWTPLMCSGLSMAGEPQVPHRQRILFLPAELRTFRFHTIFDFAADAVGTASGHRMEQGGMDRTQADMLGVDDNADGGRACAGR